MLVGIRRATKRESVCVSECVTDTDTDTHTHRRSRKHVLGREAGASLECTLTGKVHVFKEGSDVILVFIALLIKAVWQVLVHGEARRVHAHAWLPGPHHSARDAQPSLQLCMMCVIV